MRSGDAGDFSHRWGWGRHRGPARTGPWMEKTGDRPARKVIGPPPPLQGARQKGCDPATQGIFRIGGVGGVIAGRHGPVPGWKKPATAPHGRSSGPPPALQGARQKGCDPATQGIFRSGGVGGVIAGRHGPVPGWKNPATAPHGRSFDPLQPCKVPGKKDAIRRRRGFFAAVGLGASSRAGTDRSLDGKNRRPPRTEGHWTPSSPARCQAKRMRSGDAGDFSQRWGWGRHRGPARTGPWMEKTGDRPARKVIGPPPALQGARQKGCDPATQGIFRIGGVGGVIAGRHGPVPGWKKPATAPHGRSLDPLQPCKVPGKKDAIRRRRGFFAAVGLGASSRAGTDRSLDGKNRRPPRTEGHWTPSSPARCQAKRMRSGDAGDFSQRWGWGRHRGPARTGPWMEKTGDRPARKVIGPPPPLQGARQKGCDPATQGIFRSGGVGGVIAGRHGPVPGWKNPATAPHGRSLDPLQPCKVPGKKDAIRRRRGFFASVGLGASSRAGTDRSLDGKIRRPPRTEGHRTPSSPARCQAKRMRSGDAGDFSHRWGWGRHRGPARTGPWMEKTGDRPARKVIGPPPALQGARQKGCDPATQGIFRIGGVGGVIAGRHGPVPGWKKPATAPHGRSLDPLHPCKVPGKKDASTCRPTGHELDSAGTARHI